MDDLISRNKLQQNRPEWLNENCVGREEHNKGWNACNEMWLKTIAEQPIVEAVPVVHGEWLDFYGDYSTAECDQCAECYEVSPDSEPKKEYFEAFKQCYNFCPNCGADMRKKV